MDPVFPEILAEIDGFLAGAPAPPGLCDHLLTQAEQVLDTWLSARGDVPTKARVEGFRLLALHLSLIHI